MSGKQRRRAFWPGRIEIDGETFEIDMDRRVYRVTRRGRRRVKDLPTMQKVAEALQARQLSRDTTQ